jgi:hypothetical protein
MYIERKQIERKTRLSWRERFWFFLKNVKVNIFLGTIILIGVAVFCANLVLKKAKEVSQISPAVIVIPKRAPKIEVEIEEPPKPKYDYIYEGGPISMEDIKNKGCVVDGILSEYGGDTNSAVAMINRSNCVYLHRALETWNSPPDFEEATKIMEKIKKPGVIYGMFIAEAIRRGERGYEEDGREFDFSDMCRDGSKNVWGEHTCKPSISEKEYRSYLKHMTREAMDIGIQSFLFGQVYYQDSSNLAKSKMLGVLDDMRSYAKEKDIEIVIGAQTGTIMDEKYLRMFDYIEGGVGMGEDGKIEDGPCWSHLESCWALLWHDRYASKANNVLLHLDWSGLKFDDMSVFARMDKKERTQALKYLYDYFTSRNMGFLMPMMATLNKENGGCYGPKKGFYSASRKYSCQDEEIINSILSKVE